MLLQVELRNRRFEEHSALIGNASFLRRSKKPRSLSFIDTGSGGRGDLSAPAGTAAAAAAGRRRGAATEAEEEEEEELRKPRPLDLPAVVAPGVAKNQGTDAEEAFRAVGLTTASGRPETNKAREQQQQRQQEQRQQTAGRSDGSVPLPVEASASASAPAPFSPPHLFWKAVVLAPSRTRGNVGAWLEAKFGGGMVSTYRQGLASHGLCPGPEEGRVSGSGSGSGVDDDREVACGSSGSSKLIYRALR